MGEGKNYIFSYSIQLRCIKKALVISIITRRCVSFLSTQKITWRFIISMTVPLLLSYFLLLQVVFSDESTIAVLDDCVQTVRRRPGEEFLPECLKKTVKFSAKIMVWGAISVHGTSRLHIVEGNMNQVKYIEVLKGRLLPQIKEWYGEQP